MAETQNKDDGPTEDVQAPEAPAEGDAKPPGLGLSSYGDSAGGKVQSVLSPVGKPLGAGLNQVAAPLGAIIGSVVDKGIMQGGEVAGAISGKGAGNMNMENMQEGWKRTLEEKKQDDALHEPLGGEEPSGENPLGL